MRAKDIKTAQEIFDYFSNGMHCDEVEEAINGLNIYYEYMADDYQKRTIDTWLEDWWREVKEDFAQEEEGDYRPFCCVGLYEHFIYGNVKFCKISSNQAAKVFTGEIINFNGDTEVGTN